MKHILLLLLIPALVLPAFSQTKELDKKLKGLDAYIEQVRKDWKVQGVAVAIIQKDKVVFAKGYGYRDADKKLPVTPETLFAIGSSSKAFTAAGVCLLQEDNKLELDKPVINYLPTFKLYDAYATEKMTPRDLLSHRSGLPRHDFVWYGSTLSRKELFNTFRHLEPNKSFRERWEYQNLMYLAAGVLIEELSGKSWEDFTKEKILDPLGMNTTNFSVEQMAKGGNSSLGYIELNNNVQIAPYRNIDAVGPAGSMNSNVLDMSNWVAMLIKGGKYKGKQVLNESTVRAVQTPVISLPASVPLQYDEVGYGTYGLGWFIQPYRGKTLVQHGGNIDGFSANVAFMPKDSVGIVVLTNMNGTASTSIIRNHIIDRMLGLTPVDWNGRALAEVKKAKENQEKIKKEDDEARVKDTKTSHALADYTGEFEHPAYGVMTITSNGDSLGLEFHGMTSGLRHYHYDIFEGTGPQYFKDQKISFVTNKAGEIGELHIALQSTVKDIVFTRKLVAKEVSASQLQLYIGEYDFGGQVANVYLRGENTLMLHVPGQPDYELVAVKEHEFKMKAVEGFTFRFVVENNKVTEMVAIQPHGTFKAKRK
ncbi:MAG: serine hydrolase [Cyclobacteriaceae bacterium]|nr:serine hydrolase [Cyclobacteriaceae bacterium]